VPFVAYFATRMMADPTYASRIGGTFAPALLLDLGFYRGWARNIWLAFGSIVFAAAFLGALVAPPGPLRTAVRAMWGGYVLYGLGFNLHVSTHPYYQTIAVPMVACSVAALAQRYAKSAAWSFWLGPALAVVLLIIAWGQGVFPSPPAAARIAEFQAIGESVEHSDRVVFLSEDWGTPLRYYGGLAGRYWPTRFEIQMYRPLGEGGLSDEAALLRWTDLSKSLGGARYFVVTDIPELARQPDLQRLLGERFALRQKTDHYLVYEASQ
jgi:hypothetical protein